MERSEILRIIDEYTFWKKEFAKDEEFCNWLDSIIYNPYCIFNTPEDELQIKLLKQVKEKYLEIKNKNS